MLDAVFTSSSLPAGRRSISFEKFWKRAEARVLGIFVALPAAFGVVQQWAVALARVTV